MKDKEIYDTILEKTSCYLEDNLKSEVINCLECKQKLYAISSFIEFIKSGASVKVARTDEVKIIYEVELR